MFMDDTLSASKQAILATYDDPINGKYIQMYKRIQEKEMPKSITDAVQKVRMSPSNTGTI